MARIAAGEIDDRLLIWGGSTSGYQTCRLVTLSWRCFICGVVTRSHNVSGAPLYDRRFHLGMRAMNAAGPKKDLATLPSKPASYFAPGTRLSSD